MSGRLTTHVLDTTNGTPGAGVAIALYRVEHGGRELLGRHTTNADGRCDAPLLEGAALAVGVYELDFRVGDYFAMRGLSAAEPRFLDVVTVRFGVSDPDRHYHVPLLVSPYGYSSYRGS